MRFHEDLKNATSRMDVYPSGYIMAPVKKRGPNQ